MKGSSEAPVNESPEEFASRLNLVINNKHLLLRAFTHSSYLNENPEALEDNERLEFLGDAVLDFVVGAWLYNHYPEMNEGELTRMRAALVRTEQLASFGQDIGVASAIKLGRGEEDNGGRYRPAMLCAVFEAVIGALFLDGGIQVVEDFISPYLQRASDQILVLRKDLDPKSILQEWAQSEGFEAPDYIVESESGPDHEKYFQVVVVVNGESVGSGGGSSKQAASKEAAASAIVNQRIL